MVIGHTHHQFDRRVGDLRVVNAGSVGMPYEDDVAAFWTLLVDGEPVVSADGLRRGRGGRRIRASGWPGGDGVHRREPARRSLPELAIAELERRRTRERARRRRPGRAGRTGSTARSSSRSASDDPRWFKVGSRLLAGGAEVEVVVARHGAGGTAGDPARPGGRARHAARGRRVEALPPTDEDEYYIFELVGPRGRRGGRRGARHAS